MGRALGAFRPDIVLFQEIRGFAEDRPQTSAEFVHELGLDQSAYGMNFKGKSSNHGNAIYARRPIVHFTNSDLSVSRMEKRGLLSAECKLEKHRIRIFCTHLDLTTAGRSKQLIRLVHEIESRLDPPDEPFILAGDFNDWNLEGHRYLKNRIGVQEACEEHLGSLPKTFPSFFPLVRLDRVYFRGLKVQHAQVLKEPFQYLSDHRPLMVDFSF
jgi:endonuclease/exonuclease/phosphatase family metal-dependent hydrolase